MSELMHGVPMGIALGLIIGKQIGVIIPVLVVVKLGLAKLPKGTTFIQIYGVSLLCGIGFTMSLFISGLAFGGIPDEYDPRLGIILGSLVSGIIGYLILRTNIKDANHPTLIKNDEMYLGVGEPPKH